MPSTDALLKEVESFFPWVEKPQGKLLSFHESGCLACEFIRNDLAEYSEKALPDEAIRYLCREMTSLSALGWCWVLPSYLRLCLSQDPYNDSGETEYLIYNLAPKPEHENETKERLSALSANQINCLGHFIEWCKEHPHWSDYCPQEIAIATEFVQSLTGAQNGT